MGKLLWNNSDYTVQIPFIDNEHRILVALVNDIEDAMEFHVLLHTQYMLGKTANLSNGIKNHIASEEQYLLNNNYPDFEIHRLEHTKILDRLSKFESWFKETDKAFNQKMLFYLKDLLVRHFILFDHKYGSWFQHQDLSRQFD
jgi:hemerythrin-like metal-binding protein